MACHIMAVGRACSHGPGGSGLHGDGSCGGQALSFGLARGLGALQIQLPGPGLSSWPGSGTDRDGDSDSSEGAQVTVARHLEP